MATAESFSHLRSALNLSWQTNNSKRRWQLSLWVIHHSSVAISIQASLASKQPAKDIIVGCKFFHDTSSSICFRNIDIIRKITVPDD